jgi:hypothetical protein
VGNRPLLLIVKGGRRVEGEEWMGKTREGSGKIGHMLSYVNF